eukprot:m.116554 g.116554  ORF g.116554 m.116554 type:complete len:782 (+) comp16080_c1_seq1:112-2457(+)
MSNPRAQSGSEKKSEVNELRTLLRSPDVIRDPKKYREAVQKVIMYMTLGVDVSRLFSEMIMASATEDMVQRKLVYLFMCNYAESHSDVALLAVNTLQKNCRDANPMVRGLALRTMCSLRVSNLLEYIIQPLKDGLADKNSYVRQNAVLGCAKMYYTSHALLDDDTIIPTLQSMVFDRDPTVSANAVIVLEEILAEKGGFVMDKQIAYTLLNRLREYNEWAQSHIMSVLARYEPADENEVFDIMNILEERLKHANSGVVLGAANLFIRLTRDMPDIQDDVLHRLRVPLITLMASSSPELSFTILQHLQVMLARSPKMLSKDYSAFFCRYSDPSFLKTMKLNVIMDITDADNFSPVLEELGSYVTDVDAEMARHAIRAMGRIAENVPSSVDRVLSMLLAFQELDISYVTAETLVMLQDVLRLRPDKAEATLQKLESLCDSDILDEEPRARAALTWIIGEFGQFMEDAPYVLEKMIDNIGEEVAHVVRVELLTATMKLFFKRPPECQHMLGRLLNYEINDELHIDVHDRALLYYRVLRANIEEARQLVLSPRPPTSTFFEHQLANRDKLFDEYNSLSVVYGQPANSFIAQQTPYNLIGPGRVQVEHTGPIIGAGGPAAAAAPAAHPHAHAHAAPPAHAQAPPPQASLIGDLMSGPAPPIVQSGLRLVPRPVLQPADFERIWVASEVSAVIKEPLRRVPGVPEMEQILLERGIAMMASSPPINNVIKFFFFGIEEGTNAVHLIEGQMDVRNGTLGATFKSNSPRTSPEFAHAFRLVLHAVGLIDM